MIQMCLIHWGRVTHICVSKLSIIDTDNGLSPGRRQATIWTNAGMLLMGSLETHFNNMRKRRGGCGENKYVGRRFIVPTAK